MRDRWSHITTLALQERSQEPAADTLPARQLVERLLGQHDIDVVLQARTHPMLRGGWAALYPDAGMAYLRPRSHA